MLTQAFEVLDERFSKLAMGNVHLEKLFTGCRWAEGPAYFAAGRYLVWSDIPNDRIMRWDETDGFVSVFRQPCHNTSGTTTHPMPAVKKPITSTSTISLCDRLNLSGGRTGSLGGFKRGASVG